MDSRSILMDGDTMHAAHPWSQQYERAMGLLRPHVYRDSGGLFHLGDGVEKLDIQPDIFHDLVRSLDETNHKIKNGEIDKNSIEF